jgi:hypothetical protein
MNPFTKIISKALTIVGFDPISHGVVIGKNHYPASGGVIKQSMTSFDKGKDNVVVFVPGTATTESWSFIVSGRDKLGDQVTEEIYTDENTWSNTELGTTL